MGHLLALGVALLLSRSLVLIRERPEPSSPWWSVPGPASASPEARFEVLALPSGAIGAVAADVRHPETIYLGGSAGLFCSRDGGETWRLQSHALPYPHLLFVDPFDPARLYAARRDPASFLPLPGVYRSDDGGHTWQCLAAGLGPEPIFALAIAPLRPGTLYAGSWAGRVYRSDDAGEHWSLSSRESIRPHPHCPPATVAQLLVSPLDGALYALLAAGGAFRVNDRGVAWQQIHDDAGWMAIDPQRGDLYLAGRRLQRSTDGGKTWDDLSAGLPFDIRSGAHAAFWAAVNPHPPVLYTRYHRSADGGNTWQRLETPPSFVPRLLLPGIHPALYGSLNGQACRYTEVLTG